MNYRFLLSSLLISFITLSFASANKVESFIFDGTEINKNILLSENVFRTMHRQEQQESICYRRVVIGYNRICRDIPNGETCHFVRGQRVCSPSYIRDCFNQPIYGNQSYTCYRTVNIAYEVLDYITQVNVKFSFGEVPNHLIANEKISLKLKGNQVTTTVKSSGNLLMIYNKKESSRVEGQYRIKDIVYEVEFMDLKQTLGPFSNDIELIDFSADQLIFGTAQFNRRGPPNCFERYSATLKRGNRLFESSDVLFDGIINSDAISIEPLNGKSIVKIDLKKLGLVLEEGKYTAKLSIEFGVPKEKILNSEVVKKLETSFTKKFKITTR